MASLITLLFSVLWLFVSDIVATKHNPTARLPVRSNIRSNALVGYHKALRKYGVYKEIPELYLQQTVPSVHRRSENGSVPAVPDSFQAGYCSPVSIGEGPHTQVFNVQFDTGSGDFWVYSTLLTQTEVAQSNKSHTFYNPTNSSTAEATGQQWDGVYMAGQAGGDVFHDTITIGDIQLKRQNIEAAVSTDDTMSPGIYECDGIFGLWALGATSVSPGDNITVLERMFFDSDASPNEKIFTALLTRPDEPLGFYTFGSIEFDETVVKNQSISFVPVVQNNLPFWTVPAPQFFINGKPVNNSDQFAIIDTGTTLALLNDDVLGEIYEPLGGFYNASLDLWLLHTNVTEDDIPEIILPVGDHNVTIAKTDILYSYEDFPGYIVGGLQSNDGIGTAIYGDSWLRNVYAVFDLGSGNKQDFRFGFVSRSEYPKKGKR